MVWRTDAGIGKVLIRSSLSRLERQITSPLVRRCHRSYIVNLGNVQSLSGNAQDYQLRFADFEQPVLVARKYRQPILQQLPVRR